MDKILIKNPIQSDFPSVVTGTYHQAEFVKFATWYGTPGQFRQPKTQKEFADSIGVCQDTLTDWKKHHLFSFFVWQAVKEWIKDRVPDVVGGLYSKAISDKSCARDVEMLLRIAEVDIINNHKK